MRRLLLKLRRRRRLEEDLEQEIAFHRELAARQGNHVPFGSTLRVKEAARDLWRFAFIEDTWRDLRYEARALSRQPGFTLVATLALVLGIGVNVAVFAAFDNLALRPWPVPDPGRVVIVESGSFSLREYDYIREHARSFEGVAFTVPAASRVSMNGDVRPMALVSANYFDVLRVPMALGRAFDASEDRLDAPAPVAVLAHACWTVHFGADPAIVGDEIRLNDVPFTVIGVASPAFTGGALPRCVWVPGASRVLLDPGARASGGAEASCCFLVARLAGGVSRRAAQAEMDLIANRLRGPRAATLIGTRRIDSTAAASALALFAIPQLAAGAVFLLACANVGNLILARALARDRELAIRLSLGAGRGRVIRQLLAQGSLLAALAGAACVGVVGLFALWSASQMEYGTWQWQNGTWNEAIRLNARVLAYVAGAAMLATIACGLAPALQVTRPSLIEIIKRQSAQATPYLPLRGVLLGVQVAISIAVLACAALLVRSADRVARIDVGFRAHDVAAVSVQLRGDGVSRVDGSVVLQVREQLQRFGPVGLASTVPLGRHGAVAAALPPSAADPGETVIVQQAFVDEGYFDVLEMPIVAGRGFMSEDRERDPVLVNEAFVRRYLGGESPIGRAVRLGLGPDPAAPNAMAVSSTHEIVGIVRDARVTRLDAVDPLLFRVHQQSGWNVTFLVPERVASNAAAAMEQLDDRATITIAGMSSRIEEMIRVSGVIAGLTAGLGVVALLLAAVGTCGVIAYSVEGRRREIGIRMALGASTSSVIGLILRHNARPLVVGLCAGLVLSVIASHVLISQLYGISRLDPVAYAGVLFVVLAAGVAASAIPARRATRIEPARVLQAD